MLDILGALEFKAMLYNSGSSHTINGFVLCHRSCSSSGISGRKGVAKVGPLTTLINTSAPEQTYL